MRDTGKTLYESNDKKFRGTCEEVEKYEKNQSIRAANEKVVGTYRYTIEFSFIEEVTKQEFDSAFTWYNMLNDAKNNTSNKPIPKSEQSFAKYIEIESDHFDLMCEKWEEYNIKQPQDRSYKITEIKEF